VQEQSLQHKKLGVIARISQLALWPLRRVLAYSLDNPALLEHGTRLVSRFPRLFNWLVSFAQAHGIVMAAEDPDPDLDEVESVSELSPEALVIYESLQSAFRNRSGKLY
jgi:hypothetical protein